MSGSITVNPEQLDHHAEQVRTFMSELTSATADAGNTLDLQAFGIACIQPAQILQAWIVAATDAIHAVTEAGDYIAASLTQMADAYRSQEVTASTSFATIQAEMPVHLALDPKGSGGN